MTLSTLIFALGAAAGDELEPHMQAHFTQATLIQSALVEADLERARKLARWLFEHEEPPDLPEAWRPGLREFQTEARAVHGAGDRFTAAAATARMAAACGSCHQRLGARTWLSSTTTEPLGDGVRARMARHAWGMDRMWEGLIGPSDESWQQGAEALAETPLLSQRLLGEEQVRADVLANQVYRLGAEARRAVHPPDRARVYGRLLSMCADCHALFRAGD